MQFRYSILPLYAAKLKNGKPTDNVNDLRYLGVSYHFNDQGNIATCKHIVESLVAGETLVAIEMHGECLAYRVEDIRCHQKYDFAVGYVGRKNYQVVPIHGKKEIYIGDDVAAYGFTSDGIVNGMSTVVPRLFKGYITRTYHVPVVSDAKSLCEVSFPSLNGFSGTPIIFTNKAEGASLAGMLFSNFESTISLHSFNEVDDNGDKFSEQIHKVVEFGIAHTAYDVRTFINDLGITRVALDIIDADEI